MATDWAVLHLDGDPAPGDPGQVRTLATRLLTDADRAERNTQRLKSISAGDGELRMDGDYAPTFRQALGELPGELSKLSRAYRGCGQALSAFAGSLEQAQGQAAAALRQGRDADGSYQGALRQVQSLLPADRHTAVPGLNPSRLEASTADLDPGLRAEIQAAAARGRAAEADRDRARRLAQDAAALRGDAESRCARTIRSALAGIKNKQWYEKAWDWVSKPFRSWDDFVALCRNVALIAGTVALFVSGPIGLALVAIALVAGAVVFASTLDRYRRGQAGLADVGWDTLGLIPGARGVVSVSRLGTAAAGLARGVARGNGSKVVGANLVRFRGLSQAAPGGRLGPAVSIKEVKIALGKASMSVRDYDIAHVPVILDARGIPAFGRSTHTGAGLPMLGPRGRPLIEVSDKGLGSMQDAVTTIFHEIHHHRSYRLTGNGGPEDAAEEFGRQMYRIFERRMG